MSFEVSKTARVFLAICFLVFFITLGLTVWRLVEFLESPQDNYTDIVLGFGLLVNLGFFLHHAVRGVWFEVREDFFAFMFVAVVLMIYECYQFISKCILYGFTNLETIFYIRFFVVITLGPVLIILSFVVLNNFGWRDYKVVGSDANMIQSYRQLNRFIAFLEIDLQLGFTLVTFGVVGFFVIDENKIFSVLEIILYSAFTAVTMIWMIIGYFASTREIESLMIVWFITSIIEPAYVVYSIVLFYLDRDQYEKYEDVVNAFIFVGALNILNRLFLLYVGSRVYKSFGRGLKKIWLKEKKENQVDEFTPLNVDL